MSKPIVIAVVLALATLSSSAFAWDHPGHMTTGAIANDELERCSPIAGWRRPSRG